MHAEIKIAHNTDYLDVLDITLPLTFFSRPILILVYILWGKNGGRKYIYLFNTSARRRKIKA